MRKSSMITWRAGLVTTLVALTGSLVGLGAGTASAATYDLQVCNDTSNADVELHRSDAWQSFPFAEVSTGQPCTKFRVARAEWVVVKVNNSSNLITAVVITEFTMPRSSFKVWVGGSYTAPRWNTVEL